MSTACVVEHGSSRSAENSYIACRNSPLSFGMACTRSTHFILRRSLIICVLRFSFCYLCPDANPPNNAKIFNKFLKISKVLDESDRIHRLEPLDQRPKGAVPALLSIFICRFHEFCVFDETSISMFHIDIDVEHRCGVRYPQGHRYPQGY